MRKARNSIAACVGEAMKKWVSWMLVICLLCGMAFAEADDAAARDARHAFIEGMFRAAAGTDYAAEQALRRDMNDAEIAARDAAQAEYRADTAIWLMAAFDVPDAQAEAPEATAAPDADAQAFADALEIAWARFQENAYAREWLAMLGADTAEAAMLSCREICAEWLAEIDAQRMIEINADYVCWIYAPDSPIDYPIVQAEDNDAYLHRMFDGARNAAGTLFIDYRNLPDFQDPNTLIYGHHMRNDSMFGTLDHYAQPGYFAAHPWMLIIAPDQVLLLEIFAGYTTSKHDHCYDIAISDAADKRAFIDEATQKSDFNANLPVQDEDTLITLSTCAYAFENARYIIITRAVPASSSCRTENDESMSP